jgi:hypothetical protein
MFCLLRPSSRCGCSGWIKDQYLDTAICERLLEKIAAARTLLRVPAELQEDSTGARCTTPLAYSPPDRLASQRNPSRQVRTHGEYTLDLVMN